MSKPWYCLINGKEIGPLDPDGLRSLAKKELLLPTHLVRQDPANKWVSAEKVKGLFLDRAQVAVPAPRRWYVRMDGKQIGSFDDKQLRQLAVSGELRPEHTVKIEGKGMWHEAIKVKGLFDEPRPGSAKVEVVQLPPQLSCEITCRSCGKSLGFSPIQSEQVYRCPACTNEAIVPAVPHQVPVASIVKPSKPIRKPALPEDTTIVQTKSASGQASEQIAATNFRKVNGSVLSNGLGKSKQDFRPPKNAIVFYGLNQIVDLGRGPIESSLVYATGKKFAQLEDASLIELPLPTSKKTDSITHLPYWPAYHNCTPEQRGAYLDWLHGGRLDPAVELGYVFIFFYGLERRILVDGEDHLVVIDELLRLLSIYTKSNSFNSYATTLLWLTVFLTAGREGVSDEQLVNSIAKTKRWSEPILQFCLAYHLGQKTPLASELVLKIAERDQRSVKSIVWKRHQDKFRDLFFQRLQSEHPNGIEIPSEKNDGLINYRTASATLKGSSGSLPQIANATIPVFDPNHKLFGSISAVWNICVDFLLRVDRVSLFAKPEPTPAKQEAPVLNLDRIRAIHEETRRVQDLLQSALVNTDEAEEDVTHGMDRESQVTNTDGRQSTDDAITVVEKDRLPTQDPNKRTENTENISWSSGVPERYREFCRSIVTKGNWKQVEIAEIARQHGLMLGAACEAINDWSTDELDDWLIEEADGDYIVHLHLLESK